MRRIGVIGGGIMGAGIAELAARAGGEVLVLERDTAYAARARIARSLTRAVEAGKLDRDVADAAAGRIVLTTDIDDFADRDLVIEATRESEALETGFFTTLDTIVAPGAILATATSSIPVIRIASATAHPGRVVGVHFFNPAPVSPLLEIVVTLQTERVVADKVTVLPRNTR
ncbi:3-hydroxyacyl-CoA dehydrogenase NAD-binding domain-containing protein [Nocardia sp. NPDC004711]